MNAPKLFSAGLKLFFISIIFIVQLVYVFFSAQKINDQRLKAQLAMNDLFHQIDINIKSSISKAPGKFIKGDQVGFETEGIQQKMSEMENVLSEAGLQFRDLSIIIAVSIIIQIFLLASAGISLMRAAKK